MQTINQIPMIIASAVFVAASVTRMGKEKGAMLVLLRAIGLFITAIASPIVFSLILPGVTRNMDVENVPSIYMLSGLMINLNWAGAIVIIAIGTFLRQPVAGHTSVTDKLPRTKD